MAIITLTTDFGRSDHYVGRLKGLIYSKMQTANVVDITHDINNFDIQSAAFQVKHTWKSFPQHSLHFVWVGDHLRPKTNWIACRFQDHFFVLPNNGLITLILDADPEQVVRLQTQEKPLDEVLMGYLTQIVKEKSILGAGDHFGNYLERVEQKPVVTNNLIRGSIQHVDKFGNLITNISQELYEQQVENRSFEIMTRSFQIRGLSTTYSDEEMGEIIAFFNSQNVLQISQNQGNASQILGLKIGDSVQIEFK